MTQFDIIPIFSQTARQQKTGCQEQHNNNQQPPMTFFITLDRSPSAHVNSQLPILTVRLFGARAKHHITLFLRIFGILMAMGEAEQVYALRDDPYSAPKGDAKCYDEQGGLNSKSHCVCFPQKYACGPAATCGAIVCIPWPCERNADCASIAAKCAEKFCKK